jgi:hypothetical protein
VEIFINGFPVARTSLPVTVASSQLGACWNLHLPDQKYANILKKGVPEKKHPYHEKWFK